MIKKVIIALSLLFSAFTFAQEATSSPYSFYGIGEIRFKGTAENRSMAGVSVLPDSIHINVQNPAMYTNLKLTSYAVGGTFNTTKIDSYSKSDKSQRVGLDYLSIALPLKKMGVGFGLIPYTSVGYKINKLAADNSQATNFAGKGGINKVYLGFGYQITPELSAGLDTQFNFGNIETSRLSVYQNVQYGSNENNLSNITGFNFNLGLSYNKKLKNNLNFFSGLTYIPEAKLNLKNELKSSSVLFGQGGQQFFQDTKTTLTDEKITLPSKFTFGVGVGHLKKWALGTEISFSENSKLTNRFKEIQNASFQNATKFSLGGYYIPKFNSFTNYFSRIVYRGGVRYETTGLIVNGKAQDDAALTLGLGLPLNSYFSNINFSYEFGKRGTTSSGLVRETYMNFSVGLSFNDRWFIKRKYN